MCVCRGGGIKTGTQHFITQYLRGNVAIVTAFKKTDENPDTIHFKIDGKRAAWFFYFKNGQI